MINVNTRGAGHIRVSSIIYVLAIYFIFNKNVPSLAYSTPTVLDACVMVALLFLLLADRYTKIPPKRFLQFCMVFVVIALGICRPLIKGDFEEIMVYIYRNFKIALFGLLGLWCCQRTKGHLLLKKILIILVAAYIITAITTCVGCLQFDQPSRALASLTKADSAYHIYLKANIGGFSFAYEIALLFPLIIYAAKERKINWIAGLTLCFLGLITIVMMQYTTALLVCIVSVVLFFMKNPTVKKIRRLFLVGIICIVLGSAMLSGVFDWLSSMTENEEYADRFAFLADIMRGQWSSDASASGAGRLEFYQKSLNTFFETICLGGWHQFPTSGHSFILDALANYGILGILSLCVMYYGVYRISLYPYRREKFYPYFFWVYIWSIIVAIVNPDANLYIFIFILPIYAGVMTSKKDRTRVLAKQ